MKYLTFDILKFIISYSHLLIFILSQNFFKDLAGIQFDLETLIGSSLITGLFIYLKEFLTS